MRVDRSKTISSSPTGSRVSTSTRTSSASRRHATSGPSLKDKRKESLYREMRSLQQAGLDLRSSMDMLAEAAKKKSESELLVSLKDKIIGGSALWEAMQQCGRFTPYEYQSVRIGEETGRLPVILSELEEFYRQKNKLRKQMVSVFTYPAFVLAVTGAVVFFMMNNVVPMFKDVFLQFGHDLPPLTQTIVNISENFRYIGYGFLLIVLTIVLIHRMNRHKDGYRAALSSAALKIPVFGNLIKSIQQARFFRSMKLLVSARTPLVDSLGMVRDMMESRPFELAIDDMRASILRGGHLHEGMEGHKVFDRRMVSLVKVSEEVNQLDELFGRLSDQLDEEIEHRTKVIGTVIEPLMIIIIGGFVGLIMVAMYMPMFKLSEVIG